ncbi:MAG TPA: efflux RND transporter periplasmic adaptor subunit [Caulobacteraceae bacterium]|jgi:multidrug efflux system membrane fusion protein|nr:efflux RND transporter periplasmic adaptor subunit [Caulobacteraceae bacterium]
MAVVRRRRRWGFAALGLVLVGLATWAFVAAHPKPKPAKSPQVAVTTAQVTIQDMPVSVSALGAALAWKGVLIRTQVNGILKTVAFTEGTDVQAGQLLAEIDSAPYLAALTQAQGALRRDQALLEEARVDLKRFQLLVSQDSIARQTLDTQTALVKQDEGTVKLDEGAVAAAQVNVNWCRITSPVTGRVGVRLVDPGNLVSTTDTTGIVSVNEIVPIAVTFTIPQGDFQRLSDASDAFSRPLATRALSQETGADLGSGELSIADNHVDASTGTVQMKARFPNTARKLWPGQFVNVRLTLKTLPKAVTIPAAAVNQGPQGAFAYVVGADGKAQVRPIVVLLTQDATAVIKSGLEPGETVVTDGQMTLKPGMAVKVRQAQPAKKPAA